MTRLAERQGAGGLSFSAYVAGPANATKGVVVVQEIFGVNHHIRDMADRFAAPGYAVVAPALFDRARTGVELGYTQDDIGKGRDIRMKSNDADVTKDVEAAANHLAGKKPGFVGYCFGCDERGSYSKPDCDLAQQRTLAFFAKNPR